jgi:activator of HSP90 ATPase
MDTINLSFRFSNVSASKVYDSLLNSDTHSAFTSSHCDCSEKVGDAYSAYDEYITGRNVELGHGRKIVQTWRTTEFPEDSEDSILEIELENKDKDCELKLTQTRIPEGQGKQYEIGWFEHYFEPMAAFYSDND